MFKRVLSGTIFFVLNFFYKDGSSASRLNQDESFFERGLINVNMEYFYLSNKSNKKQAINAS